MNGIPLGATSALQGKDAAVDALVDEILFTVEDIMLTIQRVKNIEGAAAPFAPPGRS